MQANIETVIFDLGGVLIDWNPEYVFKDVFATKREMRYFFENICTSEWNVQQDAGRSLEEATQRLVERHPEYEQEIRMYYGRWEEMLGGPIAESVAILRELHAQQKHRLLALTNWSDETFPTALRLYDFLGLFEGIVVSGEEKLIKPDPRIYLTLIERYRVEPKKSIFIDDSLKNVEGAKAVGLHATHFKSAELLRQELIELGVLKN